MMHKNSVPTFMKILLVNAALSAWGPASAAAQKDSRDELNVAICIDCSGSMKEGGRYEMVVAGVAATLAALPDGTSVTIILFNDKTRVVTKAEPLTNRSRSRWSSAVRVNPDGGTDIIGCVGEALKHVADGGLVLVLSDGQQTGRSSQTIARSVWEPQARNLSSEANRRRIAVHTIGLSDKADKELLGIFSQNTRAEYFPVLRPGDLVAKYNEITSIIGKFWRRRTRVEFEVKTVETIITVCSESTEQHGPLTRVSARDIATPVVPVFSIHRAGITARRYELQPGKYRFDPSAKGPSDLLRPMRLVWDFPRELSIQANRLNEFAVNAGPKTENFEGLSVRWHVGKSEVKARNGHHTGQFTLALTGPQDVGQTVSGDLVAMQHGFYYRVGRLIGTTVKPLPQSFDVKVPEGPLNPVVWGSNRQVEFQLTAKCPPSVRQGELRLASEDERVHVFPTTIRVTEKGVSAKVRLRLKDDVAESLSTNLQIVAHADDVVVPLVNLKSRLQATLNWIVAHQRLTLAGFPEETVSGDRGGKLHIPIQLGWQQIEGLGFFPAVRISSKTVPAGIRSSLIENAGQVVDRLVAGSRSQYALVLDIDQSTAPGEYPIEMTAICSHAGIPINNSQKAIPIRFTLSVNPELVTLEVDPPNLHWWVRPTNVDEERRLSLTAVAKSGRPLPSFDVRLTSDPTIRAVEVSRKNPTPDKLVIDYALTLSPTSWPFRSTVDIAVSGQQVQTKAPTKLTISGDTIKVNLRPRAETLEVIAPITETRHTIWLDVESIEGAKLPSLEIRHSTNSPVTITEVTDKGRVKSPDGRRMSYAYAVTVPAQSVPFSGEAKFSVSGGGIVAKPAIVKIVVPELDLPVKTIRATATRYLGWWESVRRPFCGSPLAELSLVVEAKDWQDAKVQWGIVRRGQSVDGVGAWQTAPDDTCQFEREVAYDIVFRAEYAGARFLPSERTLVTIEFVDAPVPPWFWLVIVGSPVLSLGAVLVRRGTRPVVPGNLTVGAADESDRRIKLGKPRHTITVGDHQFAIRRSGPRVEISWIEEVRIKDRENHTPRPRLHRPESPRRTALPQVRFAPDPNCRYVFRRLFVEASGFSATIALPVSSQLVGDA